MGTVYEAHDRQRDRLVAVKTLQAFDPFQLYCLKNEFRALADLVHPNLVPLFELVNEGDGWWLVMERVFGTSVDGWVRMPRTEGDPDLLTGVSIARIRTSFTQIAQGLRALHRAGKLHRDLKPTNVLVEESGRTVLLDFGLVVSTAEQPEPAFMRGVGTAEYLAPERLLGEPAREASDWYALGVMLYELLTGFLPRNSRRLTVSALRSARDIDPEVPEELSALCDALLDERPARRPEGDDVIRRLRGEGPDALRNSPPPSAHDNLFFGRHAELDQLSQAFQSCYDGSPVVQFLEGESGIGKSALLDAFLERIRASGGARALRSRCLVAETSPYKGVDGLIDALTTLLVELPETEQAALLSDGIDDLAAMFPVLRRAPLIEGSALYAAFEGQPVRVRRRRAVQALRTLCQRLSRAAPLVLCVDDVQWGDEDAAHLLADLCASSDPEQGEPPRLFLLLLGHPGAADVGAPYGLLAALAGQPVLRLSRLPDAEAAKLAAVLLGELAQPELVERVTSLSRGQPIVLRELSLHLLRRQSERTLGRSPDLAAMVANRLASLASHERELVELMSLLGRPLSIDMLDTLCESSVSADILTRSLCSQRFLKVQGGCARPTFELFHDRLRVLVLDAIGTEQRQALHGHLASTLRKRNDIEAELLSHHFAEAGQPEQAAHYALKAGGEALASLAFGRASSYFERVLSLQPDLAAEVKRKVLLELAVSFEGQGLPQRAAETWLAAVGLSNERADALSLESRAAEQWLVGGFVERGLNVLHRIASEIGIRIPQSRLRATLEIVFFRIRTALHGTAHRPASPERAALLRLKTDASFGISRALGLLDMDFGVAMHARSLLYALQSGDALRIALGLAWDASFRGALRGDTDAGFTASIVKAEGISQQLGDSQAIAWCALARGTTTVLSGKYAAGLEHLDRAHGLFVRQPRGVAWELTMTRVVRAAALGWSGKLHALTLDVGEWLREAEDRGDAYAGMVLRMRASNGIRRLAQDLPHELLAEVDDQLQRWPRHPMVEDLSFRYGHFLRTFACLALGRPAEAERHLTILRRDPSRFFVYMPRALRAEHETLYGLVGLSVQTPRLAEAQKLARSLTADPRGYGRALGSTLQAAIALRTRSDPNTALLRAHSEATEAGMLGLAESARLKLGQLLGGDRGRAHVTEAVRWFHEQGVVSPDRFASFWLTPWSIEGR